MKTATTHYAKTHLSQLLREVNEGETVIILKGTVPVAKLVAVDRQPPKRPKIGTITSAPVTLAKGALEPLTDDELDGWGL